MPKPVTSQELSKGMLSDCWCAQIGGGKEGKGCAWKIKTRRVQEGLLTHNDLGDWFGARGTLADARMPCFDVDSVRYTSSSLLYRHSLAALGGK